VSKFTAAERIHVKSLVANLSIRRIPDAEIIKEVYDKTNKTLSRSGLFRVRQQIKKDSYHWYKTMREGEYEYIHEFKERISEIMDLQKMHHAIIDSDTEPTTVKQVSMAELHRLNTTLANYFDVAPYILSKQQNDNSISDPSETKTKAEGTTTAAIRQITV
jgi:hypothetical protein